ncbi:MULTISPECIES: winged helix-turn-helix transcriptional regulator [Ralstonia solanacearum species complex]|uniref:winged helix-turn-helix transcriptional regulator n=1 Tax=Ralstonia solanacearum species complex TaxID=3116862 RepID=UPI000E582E94|nr:helix-turn-helix domain-containing protein [Ralstonia solanacearum]BEU70644.1 helix-turn-helix domain-containing protein [Ralstonia pseudosolanacearum]AXV75678.1 transcriptional regulator [Ralstonia solanacearum]AXV89678.1 transcriptional regulator [Ralstonia solanacearum]AXW17885.1 transcriptional regulator [Ralstonia solanacearum]AXW74591.1 transcriptional regulator [Ralstonia solanacearum]
MNSTAPTTDTEHGLAAKLLRGDVLSAACPAREVLRDVTSRWGVLVLIALRSERLRYSELRRRIGGVSEKMLAQTLRALVLDGFVTRVSLPVVPPHVEYSLTAMGEEVSQRVEDLTRWIESNLPMVLAARVASSRTKT